MASTSGTFEGMGKFRMRLLVGLAAVALAGCGGNNAGNDGAGGASASASGAKTLAASTVNLGTQVYSVTTLGLNVFPIGNRTGQFGYNDYGWPYNRAYFFNGSTVVEIPAPAGALDVKVGALNSKGEVAGIVRYNDDVNRRTISRAFIWSEAGGFNELASSGETIYYIYKLTDAGQIVGVTTVNGKEHAFSWTAASGLVDLGTLGGVTSGAYSANAGGQVVGQAAVNDDPSEYNQSFKAFVWSQSGGMVNIQNIRPDLSSAAKSINSKGQVSGSLNNRGNPTADAFYWDAETGMISMGFLDLGCGGGNGGLTEAGLMGGGYYDATCTRHAYVWDKAGGRTDLGTLGGTYSDLSILTDSGQAGGASSIADGQRHAFVWSKEGGMVDLNSRLKNAPFGLVVEDVYGINNDGSILAWSNSGLVILKPTQDDPPTAPAITAFSGPWVTLGQAADLRTYFSDVNIDDTHTATWAWGDGSATQAGAVTESGGKGTVTGSHVYAQPGIYTVTLTVTDSSGRSTESRGEVVVYDPAAGYAKGKGTFTSPKGAWAANPLLAGRAEFKFDAIYLPGDNRPSITMSFSIPQAGFSFQPTFVRNHWLVLDGDTAQFEGIGNISGNIFQPYNYRVTVINAKGKPKDLFRIQIWHNDRSTGKDIIDYDNGAVESEGSPLTSGNVLVHK